MKTATLRVHVVRVIAVLGGVSLLALYVLAVWKAPHIVNQDLLNNSALPPGDRLTAEHNARFMVISIGGAIVIATGLLYTARNYRLARRGQVTDRFTKALERLGSTELYVRIGGIHALEHVVRDSKDHHVDFVQVVVAFIRDRTPRKAEPSAGFTEWMHPPIGSDPVELPSEPDPDVQAALTALGRFPRSARRNKWLWYDLSGLHLQGVRLVKTDLRNVYLDQTDLRGAVLYKSDLRDVYLAGVDLQSAHLAEVDLRGAYLAGVDLRYALLHESDLRNANLDGSDLRNANLEGSDLRGATRNGANLHGAILKRALIPEEEAPDE